MSDDDSEDVDELAAMYNRDAGSSAAAETDDQAGDSSDESSTDSSDEPALSAPTVEPATGELEEVTGTFYVKYAQQTSVTLHDVETAKICTLIENPGFERHEIVEGRLKAQPPMGVSYLVEELDAHYAVPVELSAEAPTSQVRDIAADLEVGDALAIEREGKGEIHIIRLEPEQTSAAAEGLLDDEMTYKNAARYDDVERVELRTDEERGIVSVRYLP